MTIKPQKMIKIDHNNPMAVLSKAKGLYSLEIKDDGWWVAVKVAGGKAVDILSSSGRSIPSLQWMLEELSTNLLVKHMTEGYILAEAVVPGELFAITNGLLNRKEPCLRAVLIANDFIQPNLAIYSHRRQLLNAYAIASPILQVRPTFTLDLENDYRKAISLFEQVVSAGEEGIVLKSLDATYQPGSRNLSMLKMKVAIEDELLCTGIEETIGEAGEKGVVLVLAGGVKVVVNTRTLQDSFLTSPPIGAAVTIQAMSKFENGGYRQPVFKGVRYDN